MKHKNKKFNIINWIPGLLAFLLPLPSGGLLYQAIIPYSGIQYIIIFLLSATLLINAYTELRKKEYLLAVLSILGALIIPLIVHLLFLVMYA